MNLLEYLLHKDKGSYILKLINDVLSTLITEMAIMCATCDGLSECLFELNG